MRLVGTGMILVALLVIFVGLTQRSGELVIVGAVGLALGALVRGNDRSVPCITVLIVSSAVAWANPPLTDVGKPAPTHQPKFFVQTPISPATAAEQWRIFLETVPETDRPFLFAQWWGGLADDYRRFVSLYRVMLQTVNSQSPLLHSLPVPGTNNGLWFYDVRLCGQTTTARSVVARRDKVFREPFIPHVTAEGIRRLQLVKADPATFHCESIVPGPWFLRHLLQVDGFSPTYYDLLYAQERFGPEVFKGVGFGSAVPASGGAAGLPPEPKYPAERPWPGGVWPKDGQTYAPGSFQYVPKEEWDAYLASHAAWKTLKANLENAPQKLPLPPGAVFLEGKLLKDFPADLKDFQKRWGTAAIEEFLAGLKLKVDNGEVVAGITDDPKRGSIVSYHNRLLKFSSNPFNVGGVNMSTKDFFASTGKKNLANFPKEAAYGLIEEDGGEHLNTMPNGFPAAFVTGAAKDGAKRVDSADGRLVRSSLDPHHGIVFTQYSCFVCHAPSDGVLSPTNRRLGGAIDAGRGPLVRNDPLSASVISQFATDWDWKMVGWRLPYARVVQRMTATRDDPKGWDGARLAKETVDFIGWYDYPLQLNQAAAELGVPKLGVMLLCLMEGSYDAQELFLDNPVPRAIWDEDLLPRLSLIYSTLRTVDPASPEGTMFRLFLPELLKQVSDPTRRQK
jgi:hypothetical protein